MYLVFDELGLTSLLPIKETILPASFKSVVEQRPRLALQFDATEAGDALYHLALSTLASFKKGIDYQLSHSLGIREIKLFYGKIELKSIFSPLYAAISDISPEYQNMIETFASPDFLASQLSMLPPEISELLQSINSLDGSQLPASFDFSHAPDLPIMPNMPQIPKLKGGVKIVLENPYWDQLKKESSEFFSGISTSNCLIPEGESNEFSAILSHLLSLRQGLVVGEVHSERFVKNFLHSQFAFMKGEGVTTFFLEHTPYNTLQPHLNEYFSRDNPEDVPQELISYFDEIAKLTCSSGFKVGFLELIKEAKRHGIRTVALDTSTTLDAICDVDNPELFARPPVSLDGFDEESFVANFAVQSNEMFNTRIKTMNACALTIIKKERGSGKYVCLVGMGHAKYSSMCGVAGLSDLLQIPHLAIVDSKEVGSPPIVKWNAMCRARPGEEIFANVVIEG